MAWSHLTLPSLWHSWVAGSKRYLSGHLENDTLPILAQDIMCHKLPEHPLCSEHPGRDLATHKEVVAAGLLTEVARLGAGVEGARGHQVLDLVSLGLVTGLRVQAGRELEPGIVLNCEADLETGLTRGREEIVVTVANSAVIPEKSYLFCL